MDETRFDQFAAGCINGRIMTCVNACPFHLDIPELMQKIQKSDFNRAYDLYRNSVIFPELVNALCPAPCRADCIRGEHDASLSMPLVEKACIEHAVSKEPRKYNLPYKQQRIAVIGAGISGMTLAFKLAFKRYDVTVYERGGKTGGFLTELLPEDMVLEELDRQFRNVKYKLNLNTEIISADSLEGYDAVYIATGESGTDFELKEGWNPRSFGTSVPGYFLGGGLTGTPPIESIAQAIAVAQSMEKYLSTGSMDGIESVISCHQNMKAVIDLKEIPCVPEVRPADGISYSRGEAAEEAQRCLRCDCRLCLEGCDFLQHYQKLPSRIVQEAMVARVGSKLMMGSVTRLLNSCNQCGRCGAVCPENVNMSDFVRQFRQFQVQDNKMPLPFHDYFIRDMESSNGEAYLVQRPPGGNRAKYLFFPGCQLGASDPRYVEYTYSHLLKNQPDTALILSCCAAPALWAGDDAGHREMLAKLYADWEILEKPEVLFACTNCKSMFERYLPEVKCTSLYTFLAETPLPVPEKSIYEAVVFDPCGSRYDTETQNTVRRLVEDAGISLQELRFHGRKTQCCSWGGHMSIANPQLAQETVRNRMAENPNPYIVYCSNCRDVFVGAGKECCHILEILFGIDRRNQKVPSASQRRKNRMILKQNLMKEYWPDQWAPSRETAPETQLFLSQELAERMDRELILEQDVRSVIAYCEETGNKLLNEETGSFIGHKKIGAVTYWIEYKPEGSGWRLLAAYSHRMAIERGAEHG